MESSAEVSGYWSAKERRLRAMLEELRDKHGCVALKLGTEVEACSFEEIDYINKLAHGILLVVVKIGGPNARNDIRVLLDIGVSGTIAPMVESPYGLKDYVKALRDIAGEEKLNHLFKGINIETIHAFNQLDEMLKTPEIKMIDQITIGRSDLSKSVGKSVDDPEVMKMSGEITRKAQAIGLTASVGGGITPSNSKQIAEEIKPDKINTRHVVFSVQNCPDLKEAVKKGLRFEVALMENEEEKLKKRLDTLQSRVKELGKRILL